MTEQRPSNSMLHCTGFKLTMTQIKLHKTLNLLKSQTYLPKEILLINSSSTDDTYNKINIWIKKKNLKHLFKNINSKSKNPSSSKNLGIINSKHKWLAFMDCGLFFKKNWLKK